MATPDEATVGRERAGMGGGQHVMALPVDETPLLLGMGAPEQEDHALTAGIDLLDHPVGEGFPAQMCVGVGLAGLHRQYGIE